MNADFKTQIVSTRTKALLATAMLLPAGMIIGRLDVLSVVDRARDQGALGVIVDAGPIWQGIGLVGIMAAVAGVISLLIDAAKARSDQH